MNINSPWEYFHSGITTLFSVLMEGIHVRQDIGLSISI